MSQGFPALMQVTDTCPQHTHQEQTVYLGGGEGTQVPIVPGVLRTVWGAHFVGESC